MSIISSFLLWIICKTLVERHASPPPMLRTSISTFWNLQRHADTREILWAMWLVQCNVAKSLRYHAPLCLYSWGVVYENRSHLPSYKRLTIFITRSSRQFMWWCWCWAAHFPPTQNPFMWTPPSPLRGICDQHLGCPCRIESWICVPFRLESWRHVLVGGAIKTISGEWVEVF